MLSCIVSLRVPSVELCFKAAIHIKSELGQKASVLRSTTPPFPPPFSPQRGLSSLMKYSPNDLPGPAAPIIPRQNTDLMNVLLHWNLLHSKRRELALRYIDSPLPPSLVNNTRSQSVIIYYYCCDTFCISGISTIDILYFIWQCSVEVVQKMI